MKRAIAYVSDIILGCSGEVIKRSCQMELIKQFAADNGIEILAWFEDEMYNEDILTRPGVQALLAFSQPYNMVLCERVWAFSRSMAPLESFFRELDRRSVKLESTTTMWDCVSQKCRRRFNPLLTELRPERPVIRHAPTRHVRVARPSHLHFAHLLRHPHPHMP
jgi:hypothetical protein